MTPREQILHNVTARWRHHGVPSNFHQAIRPLANDIGSNILTSLVKSGELTCRPNGEGGLYYPVEKAGQN